MAPVEPWQAFADAVLEREAVAARIGLGIRPRDFAGMYVEHADVDRILSQLPGRNGPAMEEIAPMLEAMAPVVEQTRHALMESVEAQASPFASIAESSQLTATETELLALVCRVETSPDHQRLVAYFQDAVAMPRLAYPTIVRLLGSADALGPASGLRRAALVADHGDGSWSNRMLAPQPRVVWALLGDDTPDGRLPAGAAFVDGVGGGESMLIVASGADRVSRRLAAMARAGLRRFLVASIPGDEEAWQAVVREASITGAGVILEAGEPLDTAAADLVDGADHLTWVLSFPNEPPIETLPRRPWDEVRVASGQAATADWLEATGIDPDGGFRLDRTQLGQVARVLGPDRDLPAAVRRLASGHLDDLAVRIRPRRTWSDLVVPSDETTQLHELVARFRHRQIVYQRWAFQAVPSAGLVAVFAGPSGTGKTLAAEVVAAELGLDVYKVDLSAVVSKYIGETEKNLDRIFGAAEAGEVVLFFDEADALFGKRSEVSDAHDRYANIEVAYLLQRLETYDGLVVLATNLQRNMDQAFLRRIHVAVEFPMPDEAGRRRIWDLSFPPAAPTVDLDLEFLARQFKISGGSIRNAALTAAFLAAEDGAAITMDRVMLGLKREFQKLGRLRTEAEFERYYQLVSEDREPVRR